MWRRLVGLGDSIAEGVGDDVEGVACRSWTSWFAIWAAPRALSLVVTSTVSWRTVQVTSSPAVSVIRLRAFCGMRTTPQAVSWFRILLH